MNKLPNPLHEFIYEEPVAPSIWPRRLFHILAGSAIPVGMIFAPTGLMQWFLIIASVSAVASEVIRALLPEANDLMISRLPFFKSKERFEITGATYLWIAATIAIFAFSKEIAVLALLFLAVGDPLAALVGRRDHYLRIFGKSVAGTTAFTVAAVAAGALASVHGDIPFVWWWLVPGAITAAVAELVPLPFDDNLSVPLAAGGVMTLLALI